MGLCLSPQQNAEYEPVPNPQQGVQRTRPLRASNLYAKRQSVMSAHRSSMSPEACQRLSVALNPQTMYEVQSSDEAFEQFNAHVAAGKAMDALLMQAKGTCYIEHGSVYGAAVCLPQFARTSGWSIHYAALAFRSYLFLVLNLALQGFLLFMIYKEERINDKFGGQMHLCNFGAGIPDCPDAADCIGPGGTAYSPERLYDWKMWASRVFVKESLEKLFPERLSEIQELVDPGEYGLESYWLRLACCFLFVMGLWPDVVGSWDLINLLMNVPSADEAWMVYMGREYKSLRRCSFRLSLNREDAATEDFDNVTFRVAGMPVYWKFINLVFVVIPKLYIWVLMVDVGTLFLMETAGIEDMIMNAVALSFILSIDELIVTSLLADRVKEMLEKIEPMPLFEAAEAEEDQDTWERHQIHRRWNLCTPQIYYQIFSSRLFFMLSVTCFFQVKYFCERCQLRADGSWVAVPLHLPSNEVFDFWTFIFGPVPGMFPINSAKLPVWTYDENR